MVTLAGQPRTCAQGHDIVRRTRHVQGVVAVRDLFDYPPPATQGWRPIVRSRAISAGSVTSRD